MFKDAHEQGRLYDAITSATPFGEAGQGRWQQWLDAIQKVLPQDLEGLDELCNVITVVMLGLTGLATITMTVIFFNPHAALNPFPPGGEGAMAGELASESPLPDHTLGAGSPSFELASGALSGSIPESVAALPTPSPTRTPTLTPVAEAPTLPATWTPSPTPTDLPTPTPTPTPTYARATNAPSIPSSGGDGEGGGEATEVSIADGWTRHELPEKGFAIDLPPDWEEMGTWEGTTTGPSEIVFDAQDFAPAEPSPLFTPNLNITEEDVGDSTTLDDYVDLGLETLEILYGVETYTKERVTFGGREALRLQYNIEMLTVDGDVTISVMQYITIVGTDALALTMGATNEQKEIYFPLFEEIAESLRLI